jgi:hypothetical protein
MISSCGAEIARRQSFNSREIGESEGAALLSLRHSRSSAIITPSDSLRPKRDTRRPGAELIGAISAVSGGGNGIAPKGSLHLA